MKTLGKILILLCSFIIFSPNTAIANLPKDETVQKASLKREVETLWNQLYGKQNQIGVETIEREISKWDDWILDYRNEIKLVTKENPDFSGAYDFTKKVYLVPSLKLTKQALSYFLHFDYLASEPRKTEFQGEEKARKSNEIGHAIDIRNSITSIDWNYFSYEELLAIREFLDACSKKIPGALERISSAVDHELAHMLLQDIVFLQKRYDYDHPSEDELREHVISLLQTDLRELLIKLYTNYGVITKEFNTDVVDRYGNLENFIKYDFSDFPKRFTKYLDRVAENSDQPSSNVILFAQKVRPDLADGEIDFSDVNIKNGYSVETAFIYDIGKIGREELVDKYLFLISDDGKTRQYCFKEIPYLVLEEEGDYVKVISSYAYKSFQNSGISYEDFDQFSRYLLEKRAQDTIIRETQAREVSSLMKIYFGPPTKTDHWELSDEELIFLKRHTINGQPIFKKAIEKYEIGRILKEKGWSPARIRQELEYATSYRFNGKSYDWHNSGFRFAK
jgi:hypothetical protein